MPINRGGANWRQFTVLKKNYRRCMMAIFFNFFFVNVTMTLTKCFLLPLSYQCLKLLLGRTLKNNEHN